MKNSRKKIEGILRNRILVLDGATGTELQKKGMPQGVCPEVWCLENSAILKEVHSSYAKAGSDMILTCTFGANREKLGKYGISNVEEINKKMVNVAREAVGGSVLIAADIGPTGGFIKPFGTLEFEQVVEIFKEQISALLKANVDAFAIETMMDIQEARAALIALRELTDHFTIATMTYEQNGRTLFGTDPVASLIALSSLKADAVGFNCSTGPSDMIEFTKAVKPYSKVYIAAKPNAGLPKLVEGKTVFGMDENQFASFSKDFISAGVNIIGGCCGTTPLHIRELKKKIYNKKPIAPLKKSIAVLSSDRKIMFIEKEKPVIVVGERINPTGKKAFQQELQNGQMSYIRDSAEEQEKKGANLLDVNVGAPLIDEKRIMKEAIIALIEASDLPLVIDSSKIDVIEAALRIYPGRALINSISAEKNKMEKLLKLASKYGAMFILLPIDECGIPETFSKRKAIINKFLGKAKKYGFTKDDIIIDGLTLSATSRDNLSLETLKTIEWCEKTLDIRTILGISNVSFGLPQRHWINSAFLAMAVEKGLSLVIADPLNNELMNIKKASDLLKGKDSSSLLYIKHFSLPLTDVKDQNLSKELSLKERIHKSVIDGNREDIINLVKNAVVKGEEASKLIDEVMIPAIIKVGELYEKKQYFLPQLVASAEAMEKAFLYLKTYIKTDSKSEQGKKVILIATVKGDMHDIGKSIVALMLRNHGFSVIDLGKDVSARKIVNEAKKRKPGIIGLSALMTTTMSNMKEVIDLFKKEGLKSKFLLGGAVVTESYAKSIGAEYAKDGVDAVKTAKIMLG